VCQETKSITLFTSILDVTLHTDLTGVDANPYCTDAQHAPNPPHGSRLSTNWSPPKVWLYIASGDLFFRQKSSPVQNEDGVILHISNLKMNRNQRKINTFSRLFFPWLF